MLTCNILCASKCVENQNFVWQLPEKIIYRNSEYEVHQVGPKNTESQNLSFLAFEGEVVGVTQICVQRRVVDGNFFVAQILFLSHKKS
jgi:hypothetical protein